MLFVNCKRIPQQGRSLCFFLLFHFLFFFKFTGSLLLSSTKFKRGQISKNLRKFFKHFFINRDSVFYIVKITFIDYQNKIFFSYPGFWRFNPS